MVYPLLLITGRVIRGYVFYYSATTLLLLTTTLTTTLLLSLSTTLLYTESLLSSGCVVMVIMRVNKQRFTGELSLSLDALTLKFKILCQF